MLGELEKRSHRLDVPSLFKHTRACFKIWIASWLEHSWLTVHRGIKRLRGHSGRWLWSLWSELQLCYTPVLYSIVSFGWRDKEDRRYLDRRGRCKIREGVVINLSLPSVPPQGEILNGSDILNLTEQLVLFSFCHGASVVHRPDGDAVWGF